MVPNVVVLGVQIWNFKMRCSKTIIKSIALKEMAKFGFGHKFHDLNILMLKFSFIFLEFVMNLRVSLQKVVKRNKF